MTEPVVDATRGSQDWELGEGFRETLLMYFTDPEQAAALRRLGALLYDAALQCSADWPDWTESATRTELRAAVADLRHLKDFLTAVGREHVVSNLNPEDVELSHLAADQARELEKIVEEIERRLVGKGTAGEPGPEGAAG